jgi:D-alanyl-D-alanine carboxypeptidase
MISLDDVNKFYLMEFDSHKDWLAMCESKGKIIDNKVSLQDIAEGMIIYSSNANTEFLQTYLTLAKINITIARINLT